MRVQQEQQQRAFPLVTDSRSHPFCRRYAGEWYEAEPGHGAPTEEQRETASKNCFIVGAVYLGWTIFAAVCICVQRARKKTP